jgi:hypothetical protein
MEGALLHTSTPQLVLPDIGRRLYREGHTRSHPEHGR